MKPKMLNDSDRLMKVRILNDGDSIPISKEEPYFFLGCCDCELCHRVDVKWESGKALLYFTIDERRTSQRRRRNKEKRLNEEIE